MKKNLNLLLIILLLNSCYKAANTPVSNAAPTFDVIANGNYQDYARGNIADSIITFGTQDSTTFGIRLTFTLKSGNPANYPLTCFVSGLPAGITAANNPFVFKLNYALDLSFSVNVDTGLYTFYINVSTPAGLQTYPAHLHVLPTADYAPAIAAMYYGSDPCGHFSLGETWYQYQALVATIPGHPHWVTIKNFRGIGGSFSVSAVVGGDGGTGSVIIPIQTTNGYTIYGTGFYGPDTGPNGNEKPYINIRDTIIQANDTQTCMTQLTQHKP